MPDPIAVELQRAEALVNARRYDAALPLLYQVIASNPEAARPQCLLAQCLLGLGDPHGALAAANNGAALAPEDAWAQRLRSTALVRMKRPRDALAAAQEAVRIAPLDYTAYLVLTDAELANHHYRPAQAAAERARELAPRLAGGHNALGLVALRRRLPGVAEHHFRDALAIDPENAAFRNNLGVAVLRQGRRREAVQHFADSSRGDPHQSTARRNATRAAGAAGIAVLFSGLALANLAVSSGNGAVRILALAAGVSFAVLLFRRHPAMATRLRRPPVQDPKASRELMRQLRQESSHGVRPVWLLTTLGACVLGAVALVAGVSFVVQLVTAPGSGTTITLLAITIVSALGTVLLARKARRQPV